MRFPHVIFDLDGTLADSYPWFLRNFNTAADKFGFRRVAEADIASLRRAGLPEIFDRLEVPRRKLPAIIRYVRKMKAEHMATIPLFPGVGDMLRRLHRAGVRLVLVSSDIESNARSQLGPENIALFHDIDCGAALFGKASKFRRVVRRAGADRTQVIAIGDELRDIEAARAAGISCAAVTWGYSAPEALRALAPDFVFEAIAEIEPVVMGAG